jgi:hypothetical protein
MMPTIRSRWTRELSLATAAMLTIACGGKDGSPSRALQNAARSGRADHDPCSLLSAAEAQPYVGPLASPPYRASDGAADVAGDECLYRGADGREVTVRPDWSGGAFMGRVMTGIPNAVGALDKGAPGIDSMTKKVMGQAPPGPWDRATWIPGGSLFAQKGEAQVNIDVSGASGQESDALAIARAIVPRFAHPLGYDGARAVALAPKPRPHPANACDVLPRSDVEAAIGPLDGEPTSDAPETSCTYRVSTPAGQRAYAVEFVWQGGQKNFRLLEHQMATVAGVLGTPSTSPLDTMHPPPEMKAAIGGLMKMIGGASAAGKAPGAISTVGMRTDTTLAGTWDHAALLHGTQLIAVRRDVFVGMSLESADYEKAKALLGAICARL